MIMRRTRGAASTGDGLPGASPQAAKARRAGKEKLSDFVLVAFATRCVLNLLRRNCAKINERIRFSTAGDRGSVLDRPQ
jgi:hypothetical protein